MLFSEQDLSRLTDAQKKELIFGEPFLNMPPSCHAVLVLGGEPPNIPSRVASAAELCARIPVQKVIACGAVERVFGGRKEAECDILCRLLREAGVTAEIVAERSSKDTIENILFALTLIKNDLMTKKRLNVAVVTSPWHLRRAVGIAAALMPKTVSVYGYHAEYEAQRLAWERSPELRARAENELRFLREAVESGFAEDFEI